MDRGVRSPVSLAAQQEAALASALFDHFCSAPTLKTALGHHRNLCETLHLKPTRLPDYYPKLKAKLSKSWKAQALFKKFDARAAHKCYQRGEATPHTRVLIIGAGPCGLRAAIEAQLLGAKVVVVEKRDRMSRNNVLHLWPFVIHDLRALGAKKFFGKFCAGAIDHISIRQLQIILLKVALLLGVELHEGVAFEQLIEPSDGMGWRCCTTPADHPVSQYEFDVLIGADGKRNTLEGFKRKEFRGKLAIAITANFINKRSEAEAKVEEISGVAFIFNQKFFKDLYAETGIDLENIVYYKDDTHYFVMTAKKHSLLDKGVIIQDYADTARLLALENVDRDALMQYAREAAEFSTEYQMPGMEFAVNHYGKPDVAMFDFTSMYAAENASRVLHRNGHRLLMCLVGDSLLEPFWPTGSGCARGFLSALDACWAIKGWGANQSALDVVAQRESVYRLLGHSTPENLQRDCSSYTLDPSTRYQNLNKASVLPHQVKSLVTTDDPTILEIKATPVLPELLDMPRKRRRRDTKVLPETLLHWINFQIAPYDLQVDNIMQLLENGLVLCAVLHRYRPDLINYTERLQWNCDDNNKHAVRIMEQDLGIPATLYANGEYPIEADLVNYLTQIYYTFRGEIPHVKHPKLEMPEKRNDVNTAAAFAKLTKFGTECGPMNALSQTNKRRSRNNSTDVLQQTEKAKLDTSRRPKKRRSERFGGLTVDRERGIGLPAGSRGPLDEDFSNRIKNYEQQFKFISSNEKKPKDLLRAIGKIESSDWNIKEIEKKIEESKKAPVSSINREKVPKWSREQFLARQNKMASKGLGLERQDSSGGKFKEIDYKLREIDKQLKEPALVALTKHDAKKVANIAGNFTRDKTDDSQNRPVDRPISANTKISSVLAGQKNSELCHFCGKRVYLMERQCAEGLMFHRGCLRCTHCGTTLRLGACSFDRDGKVYCTQHFGMPGKIAAKKTKDLTPIRKDRTPDKTLIPGLDLIDRGQTPERIEYEIDRPPVETEDDHSLSPMDEDEWTDRNFGASTVENLSSDENESDSDISSESSESDDDYSEALDNLDPLQLNKDWNSRKYRNDDDALYEESPSDDFYHEYSDDSDDNDTQTDGEQDARARELRRMEVPVNHQPPKNIYSNTEASTDDDTSSSSSSHEVQNSATEISTDSEFEHDTIPNSRELPSIMIDDSQITKVRGSSFRQHAQNPTKVQVRTTEARKCMNGKRENLLLARNNSQSRKNDVSQGVDLVIRPLVEIDKELISKISKDNPRATPLVNPRPGDYLLKHTQSTSGIASKTSLELKKRYLLGGDSLAGTIQKSGSASALDSKFKSFHSNISECQKLLNQSPDLNSQKLVNSVQHMTGFFKATPVTTSLENVHSEKSVTPDISSIKSSSRDVTKLDIIDLPNTPKLNKPDIIDLTISPAIIDLTISPAPTDLSINSQINNTGKTKQNGERLNYDQSPTSNSRDITPTNEHPNFDVGKANYQSENEYRCRSPAHETSIVVPEITWNNKKDDEKADTDLETDSLSSASDSSTENLENQYNQLISRSPSPEICLSNHFVPQIEVTGTSGELMQMDSLMIIDGKYVGDPEDVVNMENTIPKDAKSVVEPAKNHTENITRFAVAENKPASDYKNGTNSLKQSKIQKPPIAPSSLDARRSEYQSDSESPNEMTAALTETELSDWAVDDAVSENIVDVEYSINPEFLNTIKQKRPKVVKNTSKWRKDSTALIAKVEDFDDLGIAHVCGKDKLKLEKDTDSVVPSILQCADIDNIEFMDTGSEDSCIENVAATTNVSMLQNRGYVQFVDNDLTKISDMSLNSPQAVTSNGIVQTFNHDLIDISRRNIDYIEQGACVLNNDVRKDDDKSNSELPKADKSEEAVSPVVPSEPKPDLEGQAKEVENYDHDDDSLLCIESAADTTTSDLLTIVSTPMDTPSNADKTWPNEDLPKEKPVNSVDRNVKDTGSKTPMKEVSGNFENNSNSDFDSKWKTQENSKAYEDYIKTLQERVTGFGNIRDSIDIRKSRRKSKSNIPVSENITETEEYTNGSSYKTPTILNNKNLSLTQNNAFAQSQLNYNSPATSRKLEEISRERVKQKDLIHDLVMDKLQNKKMLNAEKRLNRSRTRSSFSPSSGLTKPEQMNPLFKKSLENLEAQLKQDKESTCDKNLLQTNKVGQTPPLYGLQKSPTDSAIMKHSNAANLYQLKDNPMKHLCGLQRAYPVTVEPDSLMQNTETEAGTPLTSFKKISQYKILRPLSMHSSFKVKPKTKDMLSSSLPDTPLTNPEAFSLPDIKNKFKDDSFRTPVAPPRLKREEEARRTAEKLRQDAKARAHMKSNEDLGLSPEDKYMLLKQKINKKPVDSPEDNGKNITKTEYVITTYKPLNDFQNRMNHELDARPRTKSVNDMIRPSSSSTTYSNVSPESIKDSDSRKSPLSGGFCTSDPNMVCESPKDDTVKKVKTKDRERRKSIIQAVSDFFHKRISSSNPVSPTKDGKSQGIYASLKSRDKSKSCFDMDHLNTFANQQPEHLLPNRCQSEKNLNSSRPVQEEEAPPIPPPPLNYPPPDLHHTSDGSQSEDLDGRGVSLETIDFTNSSYNLDGMNPGDSSSAEPKRRRSHRAIRKAELKRFRRAQENQRQREETEVKQRELEAKGVAIEKALRGEGAENTQLDEQLFASWMQLRREQQKLHNYEQMLSIQARELQLEDRHARLQNELRERLAQDDSTKTSADTTREGQILDEMLEIVGMHDALVSERDRLRNADTSANAVDDQPGAVR